MRELEKQVATMRKNYDTLKSAVDRKRKELQGFRDRARDLELESQRPNAEDSPLTRKIRMLENRRARPLLFCFALHAARTAVGGAIYR